ncbi:MAG TPA: AMP-binding protein, partial [Allocoleopsis sp.]
IRAFITGGKLFITPFKQLTNYHNYDINEHDFFISLVPTQLQKIFNNPDLTLWLSQFKTVLLGGGNSHEQLLIKARNNGILLSPTYGMTETASQIATLKPEYFLNGHNSCGHILPHAEIFITNEQGEILHNNQTGIINIKSDSLCLGYYPNFWTNNTFITDDLGMIDHQGFLHILGRNSQKIITGGENVFPQEVENTIKSTNLVQDVCIIGLDDPYWGQMITAIYVPINDTVSVEMILQNIQTKLSKFKLPKFWLKVESLPRNSQGKVNLQQVKMMVKNHLTND